MVTPPAGAIGRGDAFVLQIADKVGADVFSNDSFQEFHGEYAWLFDEGRLIGGKPVPNVGWVFVFRAPVRGRPAVADADARKTTKRPAAPLTPMTRPAKAGRAAKTGTRGTQPPRRRPRRRPRGEKATRKKAAAGREREGKKAATDEAPKRLCVPVPPKQPRPERWFTPASPPIERQSRTDQRPTRLSSVRRRPSDRHHRRRHRRSVRIARRVRPCRRRAVLRPPPRAGGSPPRSAPARY